MAALRKSASAAEDGSEFGLLDDYVLAAVLEAVALQTPVSEWGRLLRVCKRWAKVCAPVLRAALAVLWPRFLMPPEPCDGQSRFALAFTGARPGRLDAVQFPATGDDSSDLYCWAFVQPLPLESLGPNGIGVRWKVSSSGGVYVGVFLGPRRKLPIVKEFRWTPHDDTDLPEDISSVVMGCYSGSVIKHLKGPRTSESNESSEVGSVEDGEYTVRLLQDGTVVFILNDKVLHSVPFHDNSVPFSRASDIDVLFGVGITSAGVSAKLADGRF